MYSDLSKLILAAKLPVWHPKETLLLTITITSPTTPLHTCLQLDKNGGGCAATGISTLVYSQISKTFYIHNNIGLHYSKLTNSFGQYEQHNKS